MGGGDGPDIWKMFTGVMDGPNLIQPNSLFYGGITDIFRLFSIDSVGNTESFYVKDF